MTRNEAPPRAIVAADPNAATRALVAAIDARRPQLASLLGIDPESERGRAMLQRFITVALHAATSQPALMRATTESIVESIRDAAMLGLEPVGATGDGAIVVYNETVKVERAGRTPGSTVMATETVPIAHFQPMYRGLLKLARRSDQLAHIDAHVVYEGDQIEIDLGSVPMVRHFPVLDGAKRGGYLGVYAVAETRDGRRYVDWMTMAEVEIVRKKSRARDAMAWTDFWPEMARKSVLRRLMKRLPLETLGEHALRIENEAEERAVPALPASVEGIAGARERLRARLGAGSEVPALASGEAADPDGAAGGRPEAPEGAEEAPPPVSVDLRASKVIEIPDPDLDSAIADAREAGMVNPEEVAEGARVTMVDRATGEVLCGAESDGALGDVEVCILSLGHVGENGRPTPHKSKGDSRWPNR